MFSLHLREPRLCFGELKQKFLGKSSKVTTNMATRHDSLQFDGQADVVSPLKPTHRLRVGGDVCVIFVHAGAGFHSKQNERVHLEVCEE